MRRADDTNAAVAESLPDTDHALERWHEAANGYRSVLKLNPDSMRARLGLVAAQWCAGQTTQAEREMQKLTDDDPLVVASIRCGMAWGSCRYGDARGLANELASLSATNPETATSSSLLTSAELFFAVLQNLDLAERTLARAEEIAPAREDLDEAQRRAAAAKRKVNDRLSPKTRSWIDERIAGGGSAALSLAIFGTAAYRFADNLLSPGYAATLMFGSMLFLIASFYLPQILKLKVGGVELEKASLDSAVARVPLQIRKAAVI